MMKHYTIYLAGFILFAYISLLLGSSYVAQENMREANERELLYNLKIKLASLRYFHSERKNDMKTLLTNNTLSTYFSNRALGMSLEYGLQASQLAMENSFYELVAEKRLNDAPIYLRLLLIHKNGNILVDVGVASGKPIPIPNEQLLQQNSPKLIVSKEDGKFPHYSSIPYWYKRQRMGTVIVLINKEEVVKSFITRGQSERIKYIRLTGAPQRIIFAKQQYSKELQYLLPDPLHTDKRFASYIKLPIDGTPYLLAATYRKDVNSNLLTSRWYLVALVLLAVLLLFFLFYSARAHDKTIILDAKHKEAKKQQHLLEKEVAIRKEAEKIAINLAMHDPLTGLYNRRELSIRLAWEFNRVQRYERSLSIFLLDLDHFKLVNDTYGHSAGDLGLCNLADILRNSIRKIDYAARYGGEEFIVILPETPLDKAEKLAQRLCHNIAKSRITLDNGKVIHVTASIGVSSFPEHGTTEDTLLKKADDAMYKAKQSGRNRVAVAQAST
jgi:diguanylate cyclase (GGDEF)-like protein